MTRIIRVLVILIAGEMLMASIILGWWTDSPDLPSAPDVPRPDLTFLDAVTAQEIRHRQEKATEDNADGWRSLAEIYVLYGLFAEADISARRAATLDPHDFWTYLWWGTALSRLGDTTKSTEKFRAGIPHAEGSLADVCRYCVGLNLLREENPRDAEQSFRAATGYAPADFELAKLLVRSDRTVEAVPILNKLIQSHPDTEKYYQLRSRAAHLLGDFASSADDQDRADRATQVLPSDELTGFLEEQIGRHGLDVWVQEGRDLLANGAFAAAAERLREVLKTEWRQDAADLLVHSEFQLGRAGPALQIVNRAIVRSGSTSKRLVALGDIHHSLGDDRQARHFWSRATNLHLHQPAHARLAEYYRQTGNDAEAKRHQSRALLAAGIACERRNELDSAVNLLQQAVAVNPVLPHAWYHLGECRRFLNEPESAEEAYRQCLAIDPYHGRSRRSLNRLIASHQGK
jgi:tetratricopeptide (TPR) repeat protein